MKYCSACGTQLEDDAAFCTNCGKSVLIGTPNAAQPQGPQTVKRDGTLISFINAFLILACVVDAIATFGIALAWCLPMTFKIRERIQRGVPVGMTLKVCTLIFVSMVAGVLLLCYDDGSY